MSNKFQEINREEKIILPPNMEGWLEENSLARFIVTIVDELDTSAMENAYKGGGSAPYAPKMMLSLLFYSYARGTFSSRKIEESTYELIPVLYITGGLHPDHDSINTFRSRFLPEIKEHFKDILEFAYEMEVYKIGNISIDGTKVLANASKHKAMSYEYACKLEKQLTEEIEKLFEMASSPETGVPNPEIIREIEIRDKKLKKVKVVKKKIEERAGERYEIEKSEYEAKMLSRQLKEEKSGKKIGGKKPEPPNPSPKPEEQINFTDEESRIMPVSGGGFEQCYNSQAIVDMDTMLISGNYVSQNPNDKQEIEPLLEELDKLPDKIGKAEKAAIDNGYFSESNVTMLSLKGIEPYISLGRQSHNQSIEERFEKPSEMPENGTPLELMKYRMKTEEGKKFYAKRKSTVEPVFGIIKEVIGFRRFMLRGLEKVTGEWNLVCTAYNLKRLCKLMG